jgi:hypothetical protein
MKNDFTLYKIFGSRQNAPPAEKYIQILKSMLLNKEVIMFQKKNGELYTCQGKTYTIRRNFPEPQPIDVKIVDIRTGKSANHEFSVIFDYKNSELSGLDNMGIDDDTTIFHIKEKHFRKQKLLKISTITYI